MGAPKSGWEHSAIGEQYGEWDGWFERTVPTERGRWIPAFARTTEGALHGGGLFAVTTEGGEWDGRFPNRPYGEGELITEGMGPRIREDNGGGAGL